MSPWSCDAGSDNDDDQVLHAAIAFVDAFHATAPAVHPLPVDDAACVIGHELLQVTSRSATTDKVVCQRRQTKPLVTWNKNKARDAEREEVRYLRNKVAELQNRLQQLLQRHATEATAVGGTGQGDIRLLSSIPRPTQLLNDDGCFMRPSAWRDVAKNQAHERILAERENIRLRLVLETQLKVARRLEKQIRSSAVSQDIAEFTIRGSAEPTTTNPPYSPNESSEADVFDYLLRGVEESYREVDAVFDAMGITSMETPHVIRAQMRSNGGGSLEVRAHKLLPFDMHMTGSVVWHHYVFAKDHLPSRVYNHKYRQILDASEDTIKESYVLDLVVNRTSARFHTQQIIRRYIEHDRIVIVWRAFYHPLQISDESFIGVRVFEKGYIVLRKAPIAVNDPHIISLDDACTSPPSEEFTLLQTYYIATPVVSESNGADPLKIRVTTDFMLRATEANVTASHQMIENVLLEQVLKR